MTIHVVEPPEHGERALAPGAPRSSGTLPLELAHHLEHGEALLWWGTKDRIDTRPLVFVLAVAAVLLLVVSVLVPEFWAQPLGSLWKPLAALFSPAVLVLVRERANLRSTMVTDVAVVDVPRRGPPDRIGIRNIRAVRRDLLRGGIRLMGVRHSVRIPPSLMDDARQAISSQQLGVLRSGDHRPDDPLGWLP